MKENEEYSFGEINVINTDSEETKAAKKAKANANMIYDNTNPVNAAEANLTIRKALIDYVRNVCEAYDRYSVDGKIHHGSYKIFRKSLKAFSDVINNKSATYNEIYKAMRILDQDARSFEYDPSTNSDTYIQARLNAAMLIVDFRENLTLFKSALNNTRIPLMYVRFKEGIGYGNATFEEVEAMQEAKKKSDKQYRTYDAGVMLKIAELQNKVKEKIDPLSYTMKESYSPLRKKDDYLTVKKNASMTDLAKYYVLNKYLHKAFSIDCSVGDNYGDLKMISRISQKRIKSEYTALAKDPLFIDCINKNIKDENAFSKWEVIESRADEYTNMYRMMGGDDLDLLVEQAMGTRNMLTDRIEDEYAELLSVENGEEVDGISKGDVQSYKENATNFYLTDVPDDSKMDKNAMMNDFKFKMYTVLLKDHEGSMEKALNEYGELRYSTYEKVGRILALQILNDPKNRSFLSEMAKENLVSREVAQKEESKDESKYNVEFEKLVKHCTEYLDRKQCFDFELDAKGNAKCETTIKKVLKDSKLRKNLLKSYKEKKATLQSEGSIFKPADKPISEADFTNATKNALKKFKESKNAKNTFIK